MKKVLPLFAFAAGVVLLVMTACSREQPAKSGSGPDPGETLFKHNCAVCHPGGGNVINSQKTLRSKSLEANGIKTPEDIIKVMREPGPGMTKFDENAISEEDAKEIAKYILKTFR